MAVVTVGSALAAITGAFSYASSLVGEGWTRYFIILAGLGVDNLIGEWSGFYAMEGILSFVISNIFGIQGFSFPVYYGLSSLLVIFVIAPFVIFFFTDLIKTDR